MLGLNGLQRNAGDDRFQAVWVSAFADAPVADTQAGGPGSAAVPLRPSKVFSVHHHGVADAGAEVDARHTAAICQAKVFYIKQEQVVPHRG